MEWDNFDLCINNSPLKIQGGGKKVGILGLLMGKGVGGVRIKEGKKEWDYFDLGIINSPFKIQGWGRRWESWDY